MADILGTVVTVLQTAKTIYDFVETYRGASNTVREFIREVDTTKGYTATLKEWLENDDVDASLRQPLSDVVGEYDQILVAFKRRYRLDAVAHNPALRSSDVGEASCNLSPFGPSATEAQCSTASLRHPDHENPKKTNGRFLRFKFDLFKRGDKRTTATNYQSSTATASEVDLTVRQRVTHAAFGGEEDVRDDYNKLSRLNQRALTIIGMNAVYVWYYSPFVLALT